MSTEHEYVDGVHWVELCPKCQADFSRIKRDDERSKPSHEEAIEPGAAD